MSTDDTLTEPPAWLDRDRPWWAKLRRAGVHLRSLERAINDFERCAPWRAHGESGSQPGELNYHFRVHEPFPSDLLTIIGDTIHNLRSALESLVYALAEEHLGAGNLTEAQERATKFPICRDPESFDRWLDGRIVRHGPQVRELFTPAQIVGLRSVQPFALALHLAEFNLTPRSTPQEDLESDAAHRLNVLWNLDKHRTLVRLAWHLDVLWWQHEGPGWHPAVPEGSLLRDGQLLGRFIFPDPMQVRDPGVTFKIAPALADDPFPWPNSVHSVLAGIRRLVATWMIPCLFMTIEAGRSPLLIGTPVGGWPYE